MKSFGERYFRSGRLVRLLIAGAALIAVLAAALPIVVFASNAGNVQYIGEDRAKTIAREHAAVTVESTTYTKTKLERDDGIYVYDVNFISDNMKYEYEVNAVTGEIQSFEKKIRRYYGSGAGGASNVGTGSYIGEEKAKTAALTHAGIAVEAATFTKVKLDREDGIYVYEIDFYTQDNRYDYEINAVNSDVQSFEKKIRRDAGRGNSGNNASVTTRPTTPATTAANQAAYIGEARAKTIALSSAGLAESQTRRISVHLDREHGTMVYEVDFKSGDMEYEYDIDATTGDIVKSDIEYDD